MLNIIQASLVCETSQFGVSDHGLILWLYTPQFLVVYRENMMKTSEFGVPYFQTQ